MLGPVLLTSLVHGIPTKGHTSSRLAPVAFDSLLASCPTSSWPDVKASCGDCKALVDRAESLYMPCNGYCAAVHRTCVGAYEGSDESCVVKA